MLLFKTQTFNNNWEYKKADDDFIALINCDGLDASILENPQATDYFNEKYTMWHLDSSGKMKDRLSFKGYESGHMID